MPASRTRCVLIPNQVGCRLPRIRCPETSRVDRLTSMKHEATSVALNFERALTTGLEPAIAASTVRCPCQLGHVSLVPLPGVEPGTSPFVAAHSVQLSYRGGVADPGVEPGPPR